MAQRSMTIVLILLAMLLLVLALAYVDGGRQDQREMLEPALLPANATEIEL